MEPLSKRVAEFSRELFADESEIDYGSLSPYVPYSIYQSAVVQHQLWKQNGQEIHQAAMNSLKKILGYFSKRWLIASNIIFSPHRFDSKLIGGFLGRYQEALDAESPTLMLPWQDF